MRPRCELDAGDSASPSVLVVRRHRHRHNGRHWLCMRGHQATEPFEGGLDGPQDFLVCKRCRRRIPTELQRCDSLPAGARSAQWVTPAARAARPLR